MTFAKLASFTRWLKSHGAYIEHVDCIVSDFLPIITALGHVEHLRSLRLGFFVDAFDDILSGLHLALGSLGRLKCLQELDVCMKLPDDDTELCVDMSGLESATGLTSMQFGGRIQSESLQHPFAAMSHRLHVLKLDVGNWEDLTPISCLSQLESVNFCAGQSDRMPGDCLVGCFATMCWLTSVSLGDLNGVTTLGLSSSIHTRLEKLESEWLRDMRCLPEASYLFPCLKTLQIFCESERSPGLQGVLAPLAKPRLGIANTTLQSLAMHSWGMSYPDIVCYLHALTDLCLDGGTFSCFPAELYDLESLKTLQLRRCHDEPDMDVHTTLLLGMPSLNSVCLQSCDRKYQQHEAIFSREDPAEAAQVHKTLTFSKFHLL